MAGRSRATSLASSGIHTLILEKALKPFSQIPGPVSLPILGATWQYFPILGKYNRDDLCGTYNDMLKKYGPLVSERGLGDMRVVHVFNPDDIETIYKTEGKYPSRSFHLGVKAYRLSKPDRYRSAGIFATNGEEWWRIRKNYQQFISTLQEVRLFLPLVDELTNEFLNEVIVSGEKVHDVLPLLTRLNLEILWASMFGERLNAFHSSQLHDKSFSSTILNNILDLNDVTLETDSTEILWSKFRTSAFKTTVAKLAGIDEVVIPAIQKMKSQLKNGEPFPIQTKPLVATFLTSVPDVDEKDALAMSVDLLLAGMDTTSVTTAFFLHKLATHEHAQEGVRKECNKLLKNSKDTVNGDMLNEIPYCRAALKESFRLAPPSLGVQRVLPQDLVLSGYVVPKDTVVVTQNQVLCQLEEYFPNAKTYLPERWIRESPHFQTVNPYLMLPFSHGIRTCLARRRAEQSILTFILKLLKRFNISWAGGSLGIVSNVLNKPDGPVTVHFDEIK